MVESVENPINSPGVTPPTRPIGPDTDHPMEGTEQQGQPKPFTLGPEGQNAGAKGAAESEKPSPMELAREGSKRQQWSPQELQDNMKTLQNNLQGAKNSLSNPNVTQKLTDTHYQALTQLTQKMTPDLRSISQAAGTEQRPVTQARGESALSYVLRWVGSSQDAMNSAITSFGNMKNPNPANMLKAQYAMHRAQERSELFSTIIGAGVGLVKQIMSTQLG